MRHKDHVAEIQAHRILKGGFLFGLNAGGKSNFIRAVDFAQSIILDGLKNVNCNKKYFRIAEECKHQPGVFQFDIAANGRFYSYGFAISYETASVEEEWLYPIGELAPGLYKTEEEEPCVFLRRKAEDGESYVIHSDLIFPKEQETRFKVYSEAFCKPTKAQSLFLSGIVELSPDGDSFYRAFTDVFEWFQKVIVIYPSARYDSIISLLDNSTQKTELERLLAYFDTGIMAISKKRIDFDKAFPNEELREALQSEIMRKSNEKEAAISLTNRFSDFRAEVTSEDGNLVVDKLMSNHGNPEDLFDFQDESDGTRRLFDLIPLFQYALRDYVILVDELDRSLHTQLTQEFIRHYYEVASNSQSQLIVTTQDSHVMDLDLVRQDEIWFVERDEDHSSHLYSLNEFASVRFDKKVDKDYLLGRYGAVPIFEQWDDKKEGEADE